jgi:hypothetical protein
MPITIPETDVSVSRESRLWCQSGSHDAHMNLHRWFRWIAPCNTHPPPLLLLRVCCFAALYWSSCSPNVQIKVLIYGLQAASMDIDTQHQGLQLVVHRFLGDLKHHGVTGRKSPPGSSGGAGGREAGEGGIATATGSHRQEDGGDAWILDRHEKELVRRAFACSPVRFCTIHMCIPSDRNSEGGASEPDDALYKSDLFEMVATSILDIFGPQERGRTRIHEGTDSPPPPTSSSSSKQKAAVAVIQEGSSGPYFCLVLLTHSSHTHQMHHPSFLL